MNKEMLWFDESRIADQIDVPAWIDQDITVSNVMAIEQGGCQSGAYMPACQYGTAARIMLDHENTILDYAQRFSIDLPQFDPENQNLSGYLSEILCMCVDHWAQYTIMLSANTLLSDFAERRKAG